MAGLIQEVDKELEKYSEEAHRKMMERLAKKSKVKSAQEGPADNDGDDDNDDDDSDEEDDEDEELDIDALAENSSSDDEEGSFIFNELQTFTTPESIDDLGPLLHLRKEELFKGPPKLLCFSKKIRNKKREGKDGSPSLGLESSGLSELLPTRFFYEGKNKIKQRAREILELIDLEISSEVTLFIQLPEGEHFSQTPSSKDSKYQQIAVQTDNYPAMAIQTDSIPAITIWSQCPPHPTQGHVAVATDDETSELQEGRRKNEVIPTLRIELQYSAMVILAILDEEHGAELIKGSPTNLDISDSCIKLPPNPLDPETPVIATTFSEVPNYYCATIFAPSEKETLNELGVLALWNLKTPQEPEKVLANNSEPTCCVFGPEVSYIVIAGNKDGSLSMWDTRKKTTRLLNGVPVLFSTFTSGAIGPRFKMNRMPITAIQVSYNFRETEETKDSHHIIFMGKFHLASLDLLGKVTFWYIEATLGTRETDLGAMRDSNIKLRIVSSLDLRQLSALDPYIMKDTVKAFSIESRPGTNSFYVGTNWGIVVEVSKSTTPHDVDVPVYLGQPLERGAIRSIKSIHSNPHDPRLFVIGADNNQLEVHSIDHITPIWTSPYLDATPLKVQWSQHHPATFFALYDNGSLSMWDLECNKIAPSQVFTFPKKVLHVKLGFANQLSLVYEDGTCEIHYLAERLRTAVKYKAQMDTLTDLMPLVILDDETCNDDDDDSDDEAFFK